MVAGRSEAASQEFDARDVRAQSCDLKAVTHGPCLEKYLYFAAGGHFPFPFFSSSYLPWLRTRGQECGLLQIDPSIALRGGKVCRLSFGAVVAVIFAGKTTLLFILLRALCTLLGKRRLSALTSVSALMCSCESCLPHRVTNAVVSACICCSENELMLLIMVARKLCKARSFR